MIRLGRPKFDFHTGITPLRIGRRARGRPARRRAAASTPRPWRVHLVHGLRNNGSSGASSSSKEARKAAPTGPRPGGCRPASASNSAIFCALCVIRFASASLVGGAVAVYDRCGRLLCVALCSLSVRVCGVWKRFLCNVVLFATAVTNAAAQCLQLTLMGTALAPWAAVALWPLTPA